jgi:hypothetical protein
MVTVAMHVSATLAALVHIPFVQLRQLKSDRGAAKVQQRCSKESTTDLSYFNNLAMDRGLH